jgi:hypothetical protein
MSPNLEKDDFGREARHGKSPALVEAALSRIPRAYYAWIELIWWTLPKYREMRRRFTFCPIKLCASSVHTRFVARSRVRRSNIPFIRI